MFSLKKIAKLVPLIICTLYAAQSPYDRGSDHVSKVNDKGSTRGGSGVSPYTVETAKRINRIHNAGLFYLNITNFGGFGKMGSADDNNYNMINHLTNGFPLGGELPGDSGFDYLYGGGLYVGGFLDSTDTESKATWFEGPLVSTAYEGWSSMNSSNGPCAEMTATGFANNGLTPGLISNKSNIVETSNIPGQKSNIYSDLDVYDPKASAHEQFTTWYTDWNDDKEVTQIDKFDYKNRPSYLKPDGTPGEKGQHRPLGLEIKQTSYAWSNPFAQKFVIIDFTIYNTNVVKKDTLGNVLKNGNIYNMFVGMMMDSDVGKQTDVDDVSRARSDDDVTGFKQNAVVMNEDTQKPDTVAINMCWVADNDGRDTQNSNPDNGNEAGKDLNGATSIMSFRVLRNPNPKLRYSFNIYNCGSDDNFITENDTKDWGPRWKDGYHDMPTIKDPTTNMEVENPGYFGKYDLTPLQKGYSDGRSEDKWGPLKDFGGMTEGWPIGDAGRYMVMANNEFDYDVLTLLNENMATDPSLVSGIDQFGLAAKDKQAHKWKPFDDKDGGPTKMKELANGGDAKFIISFGPLGKERNDILMARKNNTDTTKTVWEFAPGDSIKLTLAFIVSTGFHQDKSQDGDNPDFSDSKVNWRDASRNAIWADRLNDVPMFDTKIKLASDDPKLFPYGKGDGWYGEDVGKDAIFGDVAGVVNFWNNLIYQKADQGERNGKIDYFTTPDGNGTNEDDFLKYGNDNTYDAAAPIGNSKDRGYTEELEKSTGKYIRYGWNDGKISSSDGVQDFSSPEAPPSPYINVESEGNDVTITWTSDNFGNDNTAPEDKDIKDKFTMINDFEGYRIAASDKKDVTSFVELFAVDKVNYTYENIKIPGKYLDRPFADDPNNPAPIFLKSGESFNVKLEIDSIPDVNNHYPISVASSDVNTYRKVKFGQNNNYRSTTDIGVPGLISYKAERISTANGEDVWKYTAVLKNRTLAKRKYVAVMATDFGDPKTDTDPLVSPASMNRKMVVPAKISGTNKVTVVPNPYRADADYSAWELPAGDEWRETDRKIVFLNVPEVSVIRIYTLAGDLVKVISHNGKASETNKYGQYAANWNLLNDNNQAVASGIYLFAVEDKTGSVEKYVGKFVIIK